MGSNVLVLNKEEESSICLGIDGRFWDCQLKLTGLKLIIGQGGSSKER